MVQKKERNSMPKLPLPEGLDTPDLECVMINVPTLDIQRAAGDLWDEDALFYGDIPKLKYAQGAVAEENAHLTLLFGLHPSNSYEASVLMALEVLPVSCRGAELHLSVCGGRQVRRSAGRPCSTRGAPVLR